MLPMNKALKHSSLVLAILAVLQPTAALAYVGPGAGLTMLGSLWGLILAVVFVVFGLLFLPFKIMRNRMKQKKELAAGEQPSGTEEQQDPATRQVSEDTSQ